MKPSFSFEYKNRTYCVEDKYWEFIVSLLFFDGSNNELEHILESNNIDFDFLDDK